ncbi:MAG TPA: FliM/FliN family flagellar motor switch protein [Pirellulales bacterium]
MGGENLSQAEVASLLGSVQPSAGRVAPPAGQAAALRRGDSAGRSPASLDFHYAERIGPAVLRALESLHAPVARDFSAALSVLVRSAVKMHITRVDQVTCAEFIRRLEKPTCFGVIRADEFGANVGLEISPRVMFPIIDRLLGGGHDASPPPDRPLTDIERRLASRVITPWNDALSRGWRDVAPLTFELSKIETQPTVTTIAAASELVVVVECELTIADATGPVRFCIPSRSLEKWRDRLLGNPAGAPLAGPSHAAPSMSGSCMPGTVELVAELATVRVTARELADLRVGDIITTDTGVQSPLVVSVDGIPRFHARPGAFKGRRALCIEERLDAPNSLS